MNKYRHLQQPEDEFDFHDRGILTGSAVKQETERFVAQCRKKGLRRIRFITGKGRHSKHAPLVGPQVLRTLETLRKNGSVEKFEHAKIGEGGDGAIDVVLATD